MKNPIELRRQRYYQLSSQIAQLDNSRLRALFDESQSSGGWGRNHALHIGRLKVFVKRLPVTQWEYENLFSTRNLYDLPTYYNYGVGSAGFGVFRELVTHIKTTNWVLAGEIATFPLTYHYRILPFSGTRAELDQEREQRYVDYWGGSANIGKYMLDRANAPYELALFLEHFPHTLGPWLKNNLRRLPPLLDDLRATITFLREKGIIHFDAHFWNVVTDGERAYLADFGLVLDKSFSLSKEEASFFRRHTHYDYGEILTCLDIPLHQAYDALPDDRKREMMQEYGFNEETRHPERVSILLRNFEQIAAGGIPRLDRSYVATVVKYRSIMTLVGDFFSEMQRNHRKDTKFPHARLRRLLKETGFLPDTGSGG